MAADGNLNGFDLVGLRVCEVFVTGRVNETGSMIQSTTGKPVQFVIIKTTRLSVERSFRDPELVGIEFHRPCRSHGSPYL